MATRTKPYVPSFSRTAARITEPCVGACVCASGSHVWNGKIGTLMPKPMNMPPNTTSCVVWAMPAPCALANSIIENVCSGLPAPSFARKYSARKLTIISAEPNSVNRKNLMAAYSRCSPPHTPIMKYIGSSTTSKNTKNRIRSCARNVPTMPVSRIEREDEERLRVARLGEVVPRVDDHRRHDEHREQQQRQARCRRGRRCTCC